MKQFLLYMLSEEINLRNTASKLQPVEFLLHYEE